MAIISSAATICIRKSHKKLLFILLTLPLAACNIANDENALKMACESNKIAAANKQKHQEFLLQCLEKFPARSIIEEDNASDIVRECRISAERAFPINFMGYSSKFEYEAQINTIDQRENLV